MKARKTQATTNNLIRLLKEESHHKHILLKLNSKDFYSTADLYALNNSNKELKKIEFLLNMFSENEIYFCRVLTSKETYNVKKIKFNTDCHYYIKNINDFELDIEKASKIKSFQLMLCFTIIAFHGLKNISYNDLLELSNGLLTNNQFEKLVFDLRMGDIQNALTDVKSNTEINKYKGD